MDPIATIVLALAGLGLFLMASGLAARKRRKAARGAGAAAEAGVEPGFEPGFEAVARRVRSTLEISDTVLVAVADREVGERAGELKSAGFDAVLVKPFLYSDVERLLAAA